MVVASEDGRSTEDFLSDLAVLMSDSSSSLLVPSLFELGSMVYCSAAIASLCLLAIIILLSVLGVEEWLSQPASKAQKDKGNKSFKVERKPQ